MNGIWYYFYAFIIIWVLALGFHKFLERHNFTIEFPMLMWKTKRLRGVIDKIANISPKFWKWFYNIGIIVSFIAMILISYTILSSLMTILETPSVSIVLPGVEMPGSNIYVPFGYGFIAIITVLVIHEFSHGIAARAHKVNIKSLGLLLVAILPGAFVEIDEEELKLAPKLTRLRIYSAGSVANMSLAAVALICTILISSFIVPAVFYEDGIEITRVVENSPSNGVLKEGMIIESINNHSFQNVSEYSNLVMNLKPNDVVNIGTNQGDYSIQLVSNPSNESRGYMGLQTSYHYEVYDGVIGGDLNYIWFIVLNLLQWIFILNLGIGLFNLLPIKPLDGGHMLEILLSYKLKEDYTKNIVKFLSIFFALVIIISIIAGFL